MMKVKCLVVWMLCTFCMTAQAQKVVDNYRPLLKDGKVWNMKDSGPTEGGGWTDTYYSLRLSGDTVLSGKHYYKMYRDDDSGSQLVQHLFLREENGKVFRAEKQIDGSGWNDALWFDFTLEPGDPEQIIIGVTIVAEEVDTVTTTGGDFRRQQLQRDGMSRAFIWVEGVGGPWGPEWPVGPLFNDGITHTMLSCYEDDECIFLADDFNGGITQGIPAVSPFASSPMQQLFDFQGRRLQQRPLQGVYIQNGRKIAVR